MGKGNQYSHVTNNKNQEKWYNISSALVLKRHVLPPTKKGNLCSIRLFARSHSSLPSWEQLHDTTKISLLLGSSCPPKQGNAKQFENNGAHALGIIAPWLRSNFLRSSPPCQQQYGQPRTKWCISRTPHKPTKLCFCKNNKRTIIIHDNHL